MATDPRRADRALPWLTVRPARTADFEAVLALAAEVEHLFGPMVTEPGFHKAVTTHIDRGSALVAVTGDVVGGLLFDPVGPVHHVDWLVVSAQARGLGVGTALLSAAEQRFVSGPGRIEVVTFGPDHPGVAARDFYLRHGYSPGPMTDPGPEGGSRQIYTKHVTGS